MKKDMQFWPHPRRARTAIHRTFSHHLLQLAAGPRVDRWKRLQRSRLISELRHYAKHAHTYDDMGRTSAPPGLDPTLLGLSFTEVYTVEDLKQGLSGLRHLYECCTDGLERRASGGHVLEWLERVPTGQGGDTNGGRWHFDGLPWFLRPRLTSEASVWLRQLSDSLFAVTIVTQPSPALVREFEALRRTDTPTTVTISLGRRGIRAAGFVPGYYARQTEYDRLFLKANREIARVVRWYAPGSLSRGGPLQAVELLAIEASAKVLRPPPNAPQDVYEGFLSAIAGSDYNRSHCGFGSEWLWMYPVDRDNGYAIGSWQMVACASDEGTAGQPLQAARRSHVFEVAHAVGPLLAVKQRFVRGHRAMIRLRTEVAALLADEGLRHARGKRIRKGHEFLAQATIMALQEDRIIAHVPAAFRVTRQFYGEFRRPADPDQLIEAAAMTEELADSVAALHKDTGAELALMRTAFREILEYRTLASNDRLQRILFWLAIVATIATLLALVPESRRMQWFQEVWDAAMELLV